MISNSTLKTHSYFDLKVTYNNKLYLGRLYGSHFEVSALNVVLNKKQLISAFRPFFKNIKIKVESLGASSLYIEKSPELRNWLGTMHPEMLFPLSLSFFLTSAIVAMLTGFKNHWLDIIAIATINTVLIYLYFDWIKLTATKIFRKSALVFTLFFFPFLYFFAYAKGFFILYFSIFFLFLFLNKFLKNSKTVMMTFLSLNWIMLSFITYVTIGSSIKTIYKIQNQLLVENNCIQMISDKRRLKYDKLIWQYPEFGKMSDVTMVDNLLSIRTLPGIINPTKPLYMFSENQEKRKNSKLYISAVHNSVDSVIRKIEMYQKQKATFQWFLFFGKLPLHKNISERYIKSRLNDATILLKTYAYVYFDLTKEEYIYVYFVSAQSSKDRQKDLLFSFSMSQKDAINHFQNYIENGF